MASADNSLAASGCRLMLPLLMIYSLFTHLAEGAVPVTPAVHITITVKQETSDGVHLTWQSSSLSQELLQKCSLHYGDLQRANISTQNFLPHESRLALKDLESNVSYYALITCQHGKIILPSNTVQFTTKLRETKQEEATPTEARSHRKSVSSRTHGRFHQEALAAKVELSRKSEPTSSAAIIKEEEKNILYERRLDRHEEAVREVPKIQPSRHFSANAPHKNPDEGVLVVMSQRHMGGPRVDPHNSKPSTSIILGVMCGVVGFVIINITIVMAVRQFSLRRDRQRRMIELQLEQHGGFIYNIDEVPTS